MQHTKQNKEASKPGLYVVSTPIGNLKDITLRALEVLMGADIIACEDTRVTQKLLRHYGIKTKMISYNDYNASKIRPELLERLLAGQAIALVSDAGTPLISDPGYKLVAEARERNIKVIPIPGASAVLASLVVSGLPTSQFFFQGFLPAKKLAREKLLMELSALKATLIIFESPRRLAGTLKEIQQIFGDDRKVVVARELTKLFEEVRCEALLELNQYYAKQGQVKGEVVILVAPSDKDNNTAYNTNSLDDQLKAALKKHSLKIAVQEVSHSLGISKKKVYSRALQLRDEG